MSSNDEEKIRDQWVRDKALHEPVANVFHTQHSGPYNRVIARNGLILLAEIGSTMHGVSLASPEAIGDIDEIGVCIEPPKEVLGRRIFEQYEYRSQPVNERSGDGDVDRTVYGLRKYVYLAAAGNPTVIMPLYANIDTHVRFHTHYGRLLRAFAPDLLSKQSGHRFLGYLDGQVKRYLDPNRVDSTHTSRPELVAQHGWDTKTGYHALRLAIQGRELMDTHTITLPMNRDNREFLLRVRKGEHTKEDVTDRLDQYYIPALKLATEESTLPETPDYDRINAWLAGVYQANWVGRGLV